MLMMGCFMLWQNHNSVKVQPRVSLVLTLPLLPSQNFSWLGLPWQSLLWKLLSCVLPSSLPTKNHTATKASEGEPASKTFNYNAVIGELLYLSHHTHPVIFFILECAHYSFQPTGCDELVLHFIGHYLKGVMNKVLIMSLKTTAQIDLYLNVDFSSLYVHENSQDPQCDCSHTSYIISVLWLSGLLGIMSPDQHQIIYCGGQVCHS